MTYLLDTNACVTHLRSRGSSRLSQRLRTIDQREIAICSVVRGELLTGAIRSKNSLANVLEVQRFLSLFRSLPFDDVAADRYAEIRTDLESKGTPIGANDLMIASIAVAQGLITVTNNVAEFSRVVGLRVEDWQ